MIEFLQQPWPWYVAGPLIGLMVPLLLILSNKTFGISSSLRHVCAMCIPSKLPFLNYNWREHSWNMIFALGVIIGGVLTQAFFKNPEPIAISEATQNSLAEMGVFSYSELIPTEVFSWENLFTLQGFLMLVVGGFLVGFGTRYAGGCTSGHSIFGLSTLQLPSLVATMCFMIGGILSAWFIVPFLLSL